MVAAVYGKALVLIFFFCEVSNAINANPGHGAPSLMHAKLQAQEVLCFSENISIATDFTIWARNMLQGALLSLTIHDPFDAEVAKDGPSYSLDLESHA